jgi:hypothetical protein
MIYINPKGGIATMPKSEKSTSDEATLRYLVLQLERTKRTLSEEELLEMAQIRNDLNISHDELLEMGKSLMLES